ncbi:cobalt-precorrin 5A hydrolase [Clostridium cellulovorans]|uniref:Cobalamin synthesis G-like n=1 Tax=Clostridium cellulovorans (strain ATCC 35296 / DSM 3052 / OCM 3 / 743B) TaxID=573061 RepID=D9SP01_CLOC7|nr:cobalt-precorrin 5A hydrolase [Clostridium cellulovorans]ADL51966.1 Cobalamin synthesis G-like [Clostridium cellulovorans 743B]
MKIAFFSLTNEGENLAKKISSQLGGDLYNKDNFKENVQSSWNQYDSLVFIMATGIVVRVIASLLEHKAKDPAVIVIDQKGKHVISLLSGHLGGANEIARNIAKVISATPVITTATDITNTIAFDLFAKENNSVIENIEDLKYISADLIEGKVVDFITEYQVEGLKATDNINTLVDNSTYNSQNNKVVFDIGKKFQSENHVLYIRPKSVVLGVGCKKNISTEEMLLAVEDFLEKNQVSPLSIGTIATIALKEKEIAINTLCEKYKADLYIADYEEIETINYEIETSEFVKSVTGVGSVAEASAYIASNKGKILKGKTKYKGITLALAMKSIIYKF